MQFDPEIQAGATINNSTLCDIFKCSSQGGMRRALDTNALVLVSNHVESLYDDRWIDDVLHYTGMGRLGDQSLIFMQNKTLAESQHNAVRVFLFEVYQSQKYQYRGEVELAGEPYQEVQPDDQENDRQVWMFPLRLKGLAGMVMPKLESIKNAFERKARQAKRLSDAELKHRAEHSHKTPGRRPTTAIQYERNPWVAEYTKRRAKGKCELCCDSAPFLDLDGDPYLEVHHIVWLAKGGDDTVANTVGLCPNCHRKMHIVGDQLDINKLLSKRQ